MSNAFRHRSDGIDWYCEQSGTGPHVVLIPSGEGDCASFAKTAAKLSEHFTVLTFDTPGFSRTSAPPKDEDLSSHKLPDQIAGLVRSLGIDRASFYGCSSGGVVALDLVTRHRGVVRNVVVHEAAIADSNADGPIAPLLGLLQQSDEVIVNTCAALYENLMNDDPAAWRALGPEYHERLKKNYVTWIRRYLGGPPRLNPFEPADLKGLPIDWTIGGLSPAFAFITNVKLATRAGIDVEVLMTKHFPQVGIPDQLAAHIQKQVAKYS